MNIVLIGFSGSGKSSIGRLLSQRMGWEFVDTDAEVERQTGRRIHEIFAQEGEAAFRRLESAAIGWALRGTDRIVSVGGGAVVDPANRAAMREGNLVVLLDAGLDTLHRRLSEAAVDEPRPMLGMGTQNGVDPIPNPHSTALARMASLKAVRDPIYRNTAHLIVSSEDADPEGVASRVADAIRGALGDEVLTKAEL